MPCDLNQLRRELSPSAGAADSSDSKGPSQPQTAPKLSDDSTQTNSIPNPIKAPFSLGEAATVIFGCTVIFFHTGVLVPLTCSICINLCPKAQVHVHVFKDLLRDGAS